MTKQLTKLLDPDTIAEIQKLHFQTRHLADQTVAGGYRSAFRGRGIEFEEVREYVPGDDIRTIDWKVTARSGAPFIKTYREERELTVMIAVDVSASTLTGTRGQLRDQLIAKIGAVLTLVALRNNDKVGLLTYSDRVESYHPPRKARSSVWRILHQVLAPGQYHPQTDIEGMCSFLRRTLKRSSILFLISDFFGSNFERELGLLSKRHDVSAIIVRDAADYFLPSAGLVSVYDPELQQTRLIDTSNPAVRKTFETLSKEELETLKRNFRKHRVGYVEMRTDKPLIDPLRRYFEARSRHPGRFVSQNIEPLNTLANNSASPDTNVAK